MGEKDCGLTKAEEKRRECFEEKVRKLEKDGYVKEEMIFGAVEINVLAFLVAFPLVGILLWGYYALGNEIDVMNIDMLQVIAVLVIFFILVAIHECIHGLVLAFYAKGHFSSIAFGMEWKALTPYCTCKEPLGKLQYMIVAIMPTIVQGIIPIIIAMINGWDMLLLFSLIMIAVGGGDIVCVGRLLLHRTGRKSCMVLDHPYKCGFVIMEKENLCKAQL